MHIGNFLAKFGWYRWGYPNKSDPPQLTTELGDAELISSKVTGSDRHKPVIDIDFPCVLYESTNGGGHLLIDKELTKEQYQKLLEVMTEIGLYNHGCLYNWNKCGMSCVRAPWVVKKPGEVSSNKPVTMEELGAALTELSTTSVVNTVTTTDWTTEEDVARETEIPAATVRVRLGNEILDVPRTSVAGGTVNYSTTDIVRENTTVV